MSDVGIEKFHIIFNHENGVNLLRFWNLEIQITGVRKKTILITVYINLKDI